MSRSWRLVGASLGVVLAGTITACDNPTAPLPGGSAGTPTATRLEISGPRSIMPGVPTQFRATVHMSDGSSRDVTTSTTWRITNGFGQIDVTAPGLLTARGNASADLSAAYLALSSTKDVVAVPEGTFRLTGIVTDVVAPAGPIHFARVEVTDGPARFLHTFTGPDGRYVLLGVAGNIEVTGWKDGYRPLVQRVTVTDHQTLNFDLPIVRQLPDVSGSWVLTVTAADTCSTVLPEEAIARKYSAIIRQVGPEVRIDVGGARFATINGWTANVIERGRVAPDRVTFDLGGVGCRGYYYDCGPSVMEVLAPSRFFLPSGAVSLAISPAALSGELNGEISIQTGVQDAFTREASCRSSRHRLTFSK